MEIRITRRICPRPWDVLLNTGQCVTTPPLFSDLQQEYLDALDADPSVLELANGMTFDADAIVALVPGRPVRRDEIPGGPAPRDADEDEDDEDDGPEDDGGDDTPGC